VSLFRHRYVVLDFETNGLAASRGGEVIETGAVRLDDGRTGETFHSLSRPRTPIPAGATAVHGISDGDVERAPRFREVLPDLLAFLDDRIVVAHNARFDRSFLDAAAEESGLPVPANAFLDTVRLSRGLHPQLDAHDLESLCVSHGIRRAARHRALPDALATAELLRVLLADAGHAGVDSPEKLMALAGVGRRERRPGTVVLDPDEQRLLEDAAVTGDRLEIRYETSAGRLRPATIVPYAVEARGPRLVAFDLERSVTRTFRLDRVVAVRAVDATDLTRASRVP
jgi:DNA polymerase III epsilon subunit family exonuclease